MKFAVFVGGVGIVFSATMADASPLRPCTQAEVQEALRNPNAVIMGGVVPGRDCEVTRESLGAPPVDRTGGRRSSADRVPPSDSGIDRSNEPCWIKFPQRGDRGFGQQMVENEDFGYCDDRIRDTIDFSRPSPRPTRPFVGPPRPEPSPQRDPFETTVDEEREYWRRKLLESLPESTDMLGNPFHPSPSWRQAPWGPGSQQLIERPRRADVIPDRSGANNQLRLSMPSDGYVAPPSLPVWQPRVPPTNILLPSVPPKRDTGGCGRGPSAAC